MKNENYYVLKTIYKYSKQNIDNFVSLKTLLSKNCPENIITHLEFRHLLNYKRENKTDYYSLTLKGIDYILQYKRESFNITMSVVAAISSILSIIIAISELFLI